MTIPADDVPAYRTLTPRKKPIKDGEWAITVELRTITEDGAVTSFGQRSVVMADSFVAKSPSNLGFHVALVVEDFVALLERKGEL